MSITEDLVERKRYDDHVEVHCRTCRVAINPLVYPEVAIPDDLCPVGRRLYEEYCSAAWRSFRDGDLT